MEVIVNYYGMIAEAIEKHEERLVLPEDGINVRQFMNERYPRLSSMTFAVAIDQELRDELVAGEKIREVALLPPFAGG